MNRREFVALFGFVTLAPFGAHGQQAMPVVGFLNSRSLRDTELLLSGLRKGMEETGFVEGQNIFIEYRWADGQYERLPAFAAELVSRPVTILVATGGEPVAFAAKAATSTIPVVFVVGGDPVKLGLVTSYPRPGGNVTGISIVTSEIAAKRLGLMHDLLPDAKRIGFLSNPAFPTAEAQLRDTREAARLLGLNIAAFSATTENEIDVAFELMVQERIPGLIVAADPFFDTRRGQLIALTARHAIPAMYQSREYTRAGGLISYGINLVDVYRQVGAYVGRILNGTPPAELPVVEQSKFELIINRNVARALDLSLPAMLIAGADEVIE